MGTKTQKNILTKPNKIKKKKEGGKEMFTDRDKTDG